MVVETGFTNPASSNTITCLLALCDIYIQS